MISSKEQLEEIKEEVELLRDDMCVTSIEVDTSADSILDDMEWLIERIQDLEIINKELHNRRRKIRQQNNRYRESIKNALNELWVLNAYENDDSVCAAYKILIEVLESESSE